MRARASAAVTASTLRTVSRETSSSRFRGVQQVLAGELALRIRGRVAALEQPEPLREHRRIVAEQVSDFGGRPHVERAFDLVRLGVARQLRRKAVGILRGVEAAPDVGHLASHVRQRVVGNRAVERIVRDLRALEIREHELRLVVEHLLEVRHAPVGIHRVAMEAAADVIAHAPERHRAQGVQRRVTRIGVAGARVLAQQEQQLARAGKLRRAAEPAVPRVVGRAELCARSIERAGRRHVTSGSADARRTCRRSVRLAADSTTLVRSVFHARAISSSTSTNPGRCQRDAGGKYVPP